MLYLYKYPNSFISLSDISIFSYMCTQLLWSVTASYKQYFYTKLMTYITSYAYCMPY